MFSVVYTNCCTQRAWLNTRDSVGRPKVNRLKSFLCTFWNSSGVRNYVLLEKGRKKRKRTFALRNLIYLPTTVKVMSDCRKILFTPFSLYSINFKEVKQINVYAPQKLCRRWEEVTESNSSHVIDYNFPIGINLMF